MISFGLGPIGLSIARAALQRKKEIDLIGAVDINPLFKGKDLSELLQIDETTGVRVTDSLGSSYSEADIVLHATSSFLNLAKAQLIDFCRKGLDVVSTTEELSFPWFSNEGDARELDGCAKRNNVTILGTGVNPGFVLDSLAITLSGACISVSQVRGERILDALKRRLPFQKKVGIGLSIRAFEENVRKGKLGHIGLPESIAIVGSALGVRIEKIEQKVTPKIAERNLTTENFGVVRAGKVVGVLQDGSGFFNDRKIVSYHIEMYAGAENPHDTIQITGNPNLSLTIPGGTPGDVATAAIVVNSIARVVESKPGLRTVKDLRPACSSFVIS